MKQEIQNQCDAGKTAFSQFILDIEMDKSKTVNGRAKQDEENILHAQFFQKYHPLNVNSTSVLSVIIMILTTSLVFFTMK